MDPTVRTVWCPAEILARRGILGCEFDAISWMWLTTAPLLSISSPYVPGGTRRSGPADGAVCVADPCPVPTPPSAGPVAPIPAWPLEDEPSETPATRANSFRTSGTDERN